MRKIELLLITFFVISIGILSGCIGGNQKPTALIYADPTSGEVELNVLFNGTGSSDIDGVIVNYTWDFGDGNIGFGSEVIHTYTNPGNYTVTLTVTDDKGSTGKDSIIIRVLSPSEFSREDAIEFLMNQIVGDASQKSSAFMLSQPLTKNDIVTSEDGDVYPIEDDTWFIFIDDAPQDFYAHPTRYIFINARNGSYKVTNEEHPPLINNISMWDTTNLSKGDLIRVYPISDTLMSISGNESSAPQGDYGDAPDGQYAYHGVLGRFPTLYNTTHSKFNRSGGHVLHIGKEMIGKSVSSERDANDSNDSDGVPNLVDADKDDHIFVILNKTGARLSFVVTVNQSAPNVTRYVNVLIDFDQNGNWSKGAYGKEWVIVNMKVNVKPGTSKTIITPIFSWGNRSILPSPVWMRISLTREKINETLFSADGWDGSGEFQYGEIEDHFVYLTDNPPSPTSSSLPWPGNPPVGKPPNPPPPPGPQKPGPTKGPCGTDVNYYVIIINGGDSSKDIYQGRHLAADGVKKISDLAREQGYTEIANLGPGRGENENSLENIEKAFDRLKNQVKCGDHVLIYIIGHGNSAKSKAGPGVNLKGSNGRTKELLSPEKLANLLANIPSCPNEDCDEKGKCCHITVLLESCHAGNFNVSGVVGEGRTIIGSCGANETASAKGGGVFTQGFESASRDEDADTNDDGAVDAKEAFEGGKSEVSENNKKASRAQTPWINSKECECKCPCHPNVTVDKWVWNYESKEWVDDIYAPVGGTIKFACEVENTGKCRNVTDVNMTCLLYTSPSPRD